MFVNAAEVVAPNVKSILLVEDHPVVRLGLKTLIKSEPDLSVVGGVSTCADAIEFIGKRQPDLIVADLMLDGCSGMDLLKHLKACHSKIPVLVLSMHDESVYAERALRAGARGYVTKKQLDEKVLGAIRCVVNGEMYVSHQLEAQFAAKFLTGRAPLEGSPLSMLTDRQLEVFRMLGEGMKTREIAEALHLSVKTIESHYEHLKQKLMLDSGVELAKHAIHWIETGQLH